MKAYLVLGCNGSRKRCASSIDVDTFSFCDSVLNPILDLSNVGDDKYGKVISFLERACGLFDKVERDKNKVSNIINFLCKTHKVIDEDTTRSIQMFMHMHKHCGFYLLLIMKEDMKCLMR